MSAADTMKAKDEVSIGLQPTTERVLTKIVQQMYVLQIQSDYIDRMLLGDLTMSVVKFHLANLLKSFEQSKDKKLQIRLEKEKCPDGSD